MHLGVIVLLTVALVAGKTAGVRNCGKPKSIGEKISPVDPDRERVSDSL